MAAITPDDDISSIWVLPDKTLSNGVHAVYSPSNSLIVYSAQLHTNAAKVQYDNQYLHESTLYTKLHNDCTRKLVNESHGIFLQFNTTIKNVQESQRRHEILKISQKYRSVLLACVEDLGNAAEASGDEDLIEQRDMFTHIELVWHLLQCLILDTQSGTRILYKLLDWIKWHFMFAEHKSEEITKSEDPHLHPDYWDTIIQFLFQGKTAFACSLLKFHKLHSREDFQCLEELIKNMPMYVATVGMSLNEFRMKWKNWQQECKMKLGSGEFSLDPGLESVCKILCGDPEVLTEKSSLCGTWYHLMVSVLLYTDPCINLSALSETAKAYYNNVNADYNKNFLDSIILAVMELDITSVITQSIFFQDGWWFSTHIADLLYHGNYIDTEIVSYAHRLREYLLSNYADVLMTHSSLWQIGVDYLDQCPESGRDLLELYLERIPLDTELKAKKIIFLAKQRKMDGLVQTISNVMTAKAIANEKLGTALSWVTLSKDVGYATELANRWMRDYTEKKKIECFEILNNMMPCMLVSEKLTFVGKYCEFHKLYGKGEFKLAAQLLVYLLSSGLAPLNFQMIMLLDAVPLLEATDVMLSAKDTYQLMACLEELSRNETRNGETAEVDDRQNFIRLALIRNLGKSFVTEHSPKDSKELTIEYPMRN